MYNELILFEDTKLWLVESFATLHSKVINKIPNWVITNYKSFCHYENFV